MRFQRSGFRPYDADRAMLPPVKTRRVRRLWWVRPRTILLAIGGVVIAAFAVDRTWIRGNGIVAGELTAVSPIVQARLQRLYVKCLDHVTRGQTLAEFDNEATVQFAAQQLQQLKLQLTQVLAGIEITEQEAQAARKLVEAQEALWKQQVAIFEAETELRKNHYVAELVWHYRPASSRRPRRCGNPRGRIRLRNQKGGPKESSGERRGSYRSELIASWHRRSLLATFISPRQKTAS